MTDQTEIPDDVMKAAREAAVYISGGSLRENTRLIAEAILAERERCYRIAMKRRGESYLLDEILG